MKTIKEALKKFHFRLPSLGYRAPDPVFGQNRFLIHVRNTVERIRTSNMDVERLGLVDECTPVRGLLDHDLLTNLPHGLVQGADLLRYLLNCNKNSKNLM